MGYMPEKPPAPTSFSLENFKTKVSTTCNVSNAFVTESGTQGQALCSNMVNLYLATTLSEYEKVQQMQSTPTPTVLNLLKSQNKFKENVDYKTTYNSNVSYLLEDQIEVKTSGGVRYTLTGDGIEPPNLQLKIVITGTAVGLLILGCCFVVWKLKKKKF